MRKFEIVSDKFRKFPEKDIKLPKRATKNSGAYDFFAPCFLSLKPGEKKTIFTDICACMENDEALCLIVRSSMGIKKDVVLSCQVGYIDSDFYHNEVNGGNISISLRNIGENEVCFEEGDRIMQGFFIKYLTVDDEEEIHGVRSGGIGSSGN